MNADRCLAPRLGRHRAIDRRSDGRRPRWRPSDAARRTRRGRPRSSSGKAGMRRSLRAATMRRAGTDRYHRTHGRSTAQTWVTPVTLEGARVRSSRSVSAISTTSPASPRTPPSCAGSPTCRWTRRASGPGSTRRMAARGAGSRGAVRDDRPAQSGRRDRQHPVHDHHARAPTPRDRLDLGRDGLPADRREPGGEIPPVAARLRDARRGAGRVQDPRPQRASRGALLGIGATFEGVLRHHTIMPDGSNRDSAFYSVLAGRVAGRQGPPRGAARPVDRDHDDRLPHRRRALPDRDRRRAGARRPRPCRNGAAGRPRTSTTSASCSSTSRAATPTCTAASSRRPTTRRATSASCSSTTRATRRPAATARSRS